MADVKFKIDKFKVKGKHPINWDEVSPTDFVKIAKFFSGDVSDPARRIVLFFDLLGLKNRKRKRMPDLDPEEVEDHQLIQEIIKLGAFIGNGDAPDKWFIPFVWVGLKKHHSPRPSLAGSTFGEFMYIDTLFQQYYIDRSGEHIWQIASIMYRPKGSNTDDIRIPFDEKKFNTTAEKWKKINGYILEAIFFNYKIVRLHIENMYPILFPKQTEETPETEPDTPPTEPVWLTALDSLCDGDLVKMEAYQRDELHNVLRQLENRVRKR